MPIFSNVIGYSFNLKRLRYFIYVPYLPTYKHHDYKVRFNP